MTNTLIIPVGDFERKVKAGEIEKIATEIMPKRIPLGDGKCMNQWLTMQIMVHGANIIGYNEGVSGSELVREFYIGRTASFAATLKEYQ
jgi:hypothetical protein